MSALVLSAPPISTLTSCHWPRRFQCDATASRPIGPSGVPLNLAKAIPAPGLAPRVLDEPVVYTVLRAVAHDENGVVEVPGRGGAGACEDAGSPTLEDVAITSRDACSDGLRQQEGLQLRLRGGGHVVVLADVHPRHGLEGWQIKDVQERLLRQLIQQR